MDASSSNSHSGGATPFKVQVNFDIPIFEGQIDADVVDKWLNMLEGYFSVHEFSNREKITFSLLKVTPMSRTSGKPTVSKRMRGTLTCFQSHPLGIIFETPSRNNITLSGAMKIST
jgi:hypothetical protein